MSLALDYQIVSCVDALFIYSSVICFFAKTLSNITAGRIAYSKLAALSQGFEPQQYYMFSLVLSNLHVHCSEALDKKII